jgi:hypothetical protein
MDYFLLYTASALIAAWGLALLIATRDVITEFPSFSVEQRRVFVMGWAIDGLTHLFLSVLIVVVTVLGDPKNTVSRGVYASSASLLAIIAVLTALTGARTSVVWYKVGMIVALAVAVLLVVGGFRV